MRQPTARDVVDAEIPGGLNVFFADKNITIQAAGKDDAFILDLEDTPPVTVPSQTDITLAATIENNATTDSGGPFGSGNPDSCTTDGGDDGTALRLVVSGSVEGSVETCVEDSTVATGPNTDTVGVSFQLPDNPSATYFVDLHIEGANSGVRVTPVYSIPLTVPAEEEDQTDFDDSDPPDESPEPPEFSFDFGSIDDECSISKTNISSDETVEVSVDLNGFLDLDAPEGSREIGILLYIDGKQVAEGNGFVTTNGSNGEDFEVSGLSPGQHTVGYELEDKGWA